MLKIKGIRVWLNRILYVKYVTKLNFDIRA
jgi:hypothetical protein